MTTSRTCGITGKTKTEYTIIKSGAGESPCSAFSMCTSIEMKDIQNRGNDPILFDGGRIKLQNNKENEIDELLHNGTSKTFSQDIFYI